MQRTLTVRCKVINEWVGEIRGEVLKSSKKISFLGDIDANNGVVVAKDSDIFGESITNKVLVFPGGRGSTVGAGVLYSLSRKNLAPKLLVTVDVDQVVVSGAVFGDIPAVSFLPLDIFQEIESGDTIIARIEDDLAELKILKKR